MFSAALYAHARHFYYFAHETSGAARIRHSLRPLDSEDARIPANLGRNASRECSLIFGVVLAHAGTQYPRDANDRIEKPRRTGSPGPVSSNRLRPKADFGASRGYDEATNSPGTPKLGEGGKP